MGKFLATPKGSLPGLPSSLPGLPTGPSSASAAITGILAKVGTSKSSTPPGPTSRSPLPMPLAMPKGAVLPGSGQGQSEGSQQQPQTAPTIPKSSRGGGSRWGPEDGAPESYQEAGDAQQSQGYPLVTPKSKAGSRGLPSPPAPSMAPAMPKRPQQGAHEMPGPTGAAPLSKSSAMAGLSEGIAAAPTSKSSAADPAPTAAPTPKKSLPSPLPKPGASADKRKGWTDMMRKAADAVSARVNGGGGGDQGISEG